MPQMVRKQVYLERGQDARIKRLARRLEITEAEVIRRALDREGGESEPEVRDEAAWTREKAFILKRAGQRQIPTERTWRREDLYEERLSRYGRDLPG